MPDFYNISRIFVQDNCVPIRTPHGFNPPMMLSSSQSWKKKTIELLFKYLISSIFAGLYFSLLRPLNFTAFAKFVVQCPLRRSWTIERSSFGRRWQISNSEKVWASSNNLGWRRNDLLFQRKIEKSAERILPAKQISKSGRKETVGPNDWTQSTSSQ